MIGGEPSHGNLGRQCGIARCAQPCWRASTAAHPAVAVDRGQRDSADGARRTFPPPERLEGGETPAPVDAAVPLLRFRCVLVRTESRRDGTIRTFAPLSAMNYLAMLSQVD